MTQAEKIDKIYEVVMEMKGDYKVLKEHSLEHHKTLYGNGKPGLVSEFQSVREMQASCPALQEALLKPKGRALRVSNRIALAALIVSTLVGLMSVAVAVFVAVWS